jgi:dihydroneopterin aldolase
MIGTAAASTRFLVSVRSAEEAQVALDGGADIVDAKEPASGALGAVAPEAIEAILQAVGGRRPVSATIGDCDLDDAAPRVIAAARTGVDYVKVGLFDAPSASALKALERCASDGVRLIAVLFADRAPDWSVMTALAGAGFAGVMLDTADKARGALRNHLGERDLAQFLARARMHGMMAGLAGSLQAGDVPALLPLRPDIVGFRGALCASRLRTQTLELERVRAMRRLLDMDQTADMAWEA